MKNVAPSLEQTSPAKRAQLAADWPTAQQAGLAMGLDLESASRFVTRCRHEGGLLGVRRPMRLIIRTNQR